MFADIWLFTASGQRKTFSFLLFSANSFLFRKTVLLRRGEREREQRGEERETNRINKPPLTQHGRASSPGGCVYGGLLPAGQSGTLIALKSQGD